MIAHMMRTDLPWAGFENILNMHHGLRSTQSNPQRLAGNTSYMLREDDDAFHLSLDVPGLAPDQLELSVSDREFTLQCAPRDKAPDDASLRLSERSSQARRLHARFAKPVDPERVETSLEYGVLSVVFPKQATAKPRIVRVVEAQSPSDVGV